MKVPAINVPDVDTFGSNKHRRIRVWRTPKFLACCEVMARLDIPTDAAWKLLTHEDNHKVFGSLKRTNPRNYKKRGIFETIYEVEHVTGWSLLWLSGEFITKLKVTENRGSKSVEFKLLKSDIMKDFHGSWKLQPCTQAGMNKLYGKRGNPFEGIIGLFGGRKSTTSLIDFNQQMEPKTTPGPLKGLVRRIAAGALKRTMDDLQAEAKRIKQGKPTLAGFEQWAEAPAKKGGKELGKSVKGLGKGLKAGDLEKGVKDIEKGVKDVQKGVKDFSKDVKELRKDAEAIGKDAEKAVKDVKAAAKKAAKELEGNSGSLTLSHGQLWQAIANGPLVGRMQVLALW